MTNEMIKEIMMLDKCTEREADKYINRGSIVYDGWNEFIESEVEAGVEPDDLYEYDKAKRGCYTGISVVNYGAKEYVIVYVL